MPERRTIIFYIACAILLTISMAGSSMLRERQQARTLEQQARDTPSEMMRAIKLYFPDEWADIERHDPTTQGARNEIAVGAVFMSAKLRHLADAPDSALLDIIRNEMTLTRHLQQENIEHCAEFIVAGPASARTYSTTSAALLDKIAASAVIAAGRGIETPQPRSDDPEANSRELSQAMRDRGVADHLVDNLGTPLLSPAEQCQAGLQLYETLLALPAAKAASLYATLKYTPT